MTGLEPEETGEKSMQQNIPGVNPGKEFSLYPNPAENSITLAYSGNIDELKQCVLEIYDIYGVKVKSIQIADVVMQIDINELAAGIYMYNILQADKRICFKKLIKL